MDTDEETINKLKRKIALFERERTILLVALSDAFGMAGCGPMPDDVREVLFETAKLHTEIDYVLD